VYGCRKEKDDPWRNRLAHHRYNGGVEMGESERETGAAVSASGSRSSLGISRRWGQRARMPSLTRKEESPPKRQSRYFASRDELEAGKSTG